MNVLKLPVLWKCSFKDKYSSCLRPPAPFLSTPMEHPLQGPPDLKTRRKQPVQSCLSKESLISPLSTSSLSDTPLSGKSFLAAFHRVPFSDLSKARDRTSDTRCRRTFLSCQVVSPQTRALQAETSNYNASQKALTLRAVQSPYPLRLGHLVRRPLHGWEESAMLHWGWLEHSKFVWITWFLKCKSQHWLDGLKTLLFTAYIFWTFCKIPSKKNELRICVEEMYKMLKRSDARISSHLRFSNIYFSS